MADTGARSPTASSGLTYLAANMYDGNATTAGGIIKVGGGTTSDCTFSAIAGSDIPAGATINGVQWAFNASAIVFFSYENTSLIDLKLSLDGGSNFSSALGTINLTSTYGGYNWAIGYDEFELTSYKLSLLGFEYQFHYKNSTTLRFIINHISRYNNLLFDVPEIKDPINYGFGIKIRSLLGPINFTWGRGYDTIMNEKSKRTNIFYFNFGVHL